MIRAIALDLDGVVYIGDQLLPGAAEAVASLRRRFDVWFVTNNSAHTRAAIAAKLTRLGVPAAESDVVTSGYAVSLLVSRLAQGKMARVVVIGSEDLSTMVAAQGLQPVAEAPGDYLVVGLDKAFTYRKIKIAMDTLVGQAVFIACNRDATYPVENGQLMPGCGPIVAAIECAAGRKADYVVGKPGPMLLEIVAATGGLRSDELLLVGDSQESDIAAARSFGSPAALVSGYTRTQLVSPVPGPDQPYLVVHTLADLPGLMA